MPKNYIPQKTRKEVFERAGHCCEYCKSPKSHVPIPFDVEHIVPPNRGGTDDFANLACSFHGCNLFKMYFTEAIDPFTQELVSLFHPRIDKWKEHFAWAENFTSVVGLTPTGRATVLQLRLNRAALLNFRDVMVKSNKFPPKVS